MSRRHCPQPQCDFCSKFMTWKDARNGVQFTPFGSVGDIDPPDGQFVHVRCWKADPDHQRLVRRIAWMGPTIRNKSA